MTNEKTKDILEDRKREDGLSREQQRKDRTPLYKQSAVTLKNRDPLFHYRLVNDTPGRIASFLQAGWEIVEGDNSETYSGKGRSEATQKGTMMTRRVNERNDAPCHDAYMMRIPKELYEEDQKAKEKGWDQVEAEIDSTGELKKARILGPRANINNLLK